MSRAGHGAEAIENSPVVRSIREVLVEDATRIFGVFGTLSIAIAIFRNHQTGTTSWMNHLPAAALGLLLALHIAKRWVPAGIRSGYLVAALLLVAANGLVCMGSSSQSAFWIPLAIVIAWATMRTAAFRFSTAAAVTIFVGCAAFVVLNGTLVADSSRDPSRYPAYWVNLLVVLTIFGSMAFQAVRRIVNALVDNDRRTRADRDRLAGILEGIQDAVIVMDPRDGRFLESNRAATGMFGFTAAELKGATFGKICSTGLLHTEAMSSDHFKVALARGAHDFVWRHRNAVGKGFWAEVYAKVFVVGDEKRLLLSIRDIDERISRHKDLEKLNQALEARVLERSQKLERARQELQTFSYAVSHDLRAPLRAASGFAQALREEYAQVLDETGRQAIDRILTGSERMSRLIEALLELSRIDRVPCVRVSVDMASVATDCAAKIRLKSAPAVDIEVDALPQCQSDPEMVRQLWSMLLDNAFKFSAGVERARIRVGSESRDDGIWYTISDNGIGFNMEHAHKLFILFHRLHGADVAGDGIGLAVVKRILDRLGGAVEAEGAAGRGSVFKFRPGPAIQQV
ncbi:MAG: hypothetical protein RL173_2892 [Fibrobacterota bacterium]|jgi:PAS domain S-box-containing protein